MFYFYSIYCNNNSQKFIQMPKENILDTFDLNNFTKWDIKKRIIAVYNKRMPFLASLKDKTYCDVIVHHQKNKAEKTQCGNIRFYLMLCQINPHYLGI